MDYVVVGRRTESKKSNSTLRHLGVVIFNYLLRVEIFYLITTALNTAMFKHLTLKGMNQIFKKEDTSFAALSMIKKTLSLLLFIFLLMACSKPEKKETVVKKEVNELPHLAFKNLDGSAATTRDLPPASVLILFNTDCDHCQREAKSIQENLESFKGYTLQFIASDPEQRILQFAREYQLDNQPNIRFGRAEGQDVYMNFGSIPTPSIYVYSKERKFIKSFLGETPVEQIIMSL